MHANGYRDAAQEILDYLEHNDVPGAKVAFEQYFDLYGQLGCTLRSHLVEVGLAQAAYECLDRLCAQIESGFLKGADFDFLRRLTKNYSPGREHLLADAPA